MYCINKQLKEIDEINGMVTQWCKDEKSKFNNLSITLRMQVLPEV